MISGVAKAAPAGSVNGSYGLLLSLSPQQAANFGVASFDGAGNVAMSLTFVSLGGAGGQSSLFSATQTGT
jgi:hypothetical protein